MVQRQKKGCVPESGFQFPASLLYFIFPLRKILLMWVGGSVRACQGPKGVHLGHIVSDLEKGIKQKVSIGHRGVQGEKFMALSSMHEKHENEISPAPSTKGKGFFQQQLCTPPYIPQNDQYVDHFDVSMFG